jgi:hypothetical protein
VPILILAIVASAIVFAPLSSWLALRRGRSWAAWFFFGMVLGPLAVGLLIAAPPGRCPLCGTRTRGWPLRCSGCGLAFAGGAAPEPAGAVPEAAGGAGRQWAATETAGALPPVARASRSGSGGRKAAAAGLSASDPSHRPATVLGRRPTTVAAPAPPAKSSGSDVAILGSGIFMGGSTALQIGSRYLLARVGSELQALGPMHVSPASVAARIPLAGTETTVAADRLVIAPRSGGRGATLAFSALATEPGVDFEEQLKVRTRRKAAAT